MKDPKNLDPSGELEEFLKEKEDCTNEVYDDPPSDEDDKPNCTIGCGHLIHYGPCGSKPDHVEYQTLKDGISDEKANEIFQDDLKNRGSKYIDDYIDVKLTQYQFDALTSIIFNAGSGRFEDSDIRSLINSKANTEKITSKIETFYAGTSGVKSRRKTEAKMFTGDYKL